MAPLSAQKSIGSTFPFPPPLQNVALALTELIAWLIPHVPESLSIISRYETRVINELLLRGEREIDRSAGQSPQSRSKTTPLVLHCLEEMKVGG